MLNRRLRMEGWRTAAKTGRENLSLKWKEEIGKTLDRDRLSHGRQYDEGKVEEAAVIMLPCVTD